MACDASSRCCACASAREPSADDLLVMPGYNVSVPPFVRRALFSRSIDNDDLLVRIRKPC